MKRRCSPLKTWMPLLIAGWLGVTAQAQIGDKAGEAQVPLVPKELIPPAPVVPPDQALSTFRLAPGIRLELVANEPLVQEPVAAVFDPDGRLWVVEMRGYMPDLEGTGEDLPVGRVVILTDVDGDGRFDRSDVFLDEQIMPRTLALVRDGLLVGTPPYLRFWRDSNGDGRADEMEVVATDYGVQTDPKRPHLANPERAPNSLLWALDNWIYSTAYTKKYRYVNGQWQSAPTTFRGQWGLSQDDFGRLFYNSNSDQVRGDIIPSDYLGRNPHYARGAGTNVKVAPDQFVWPARVTPGTNRAYRPETMRGGKLKEFTAACAPWVYRADLFPEDFYGNIFVAEPAANLIKRNRVTAAEGTLVAKEAYVQQEFIASTDERFRPVNFVTGPDGALYIVDLYRGVLQHRISLTTYLRRQIEDRGLDVPLHLGRIYRVSPEGATPTTERPRMSQETPAQWVRHLAKDNSWWRETAQRLLVERGDKSVVPALRSLAREGASGPTRLYALATLDGLDALDQELLLAALDDAAPEVQVAAIRLSERFFRGRSRHPLLAKLLQLPTDHKPEVQLQQMLSLGEAGDPAVDVAMARMLLKAPKNQFLPDAFYSGLYNREWALLKRLAADPALAVDNPVANRLLGTLARCVFATLDAEQIGQLLDLAAGLPASAQARQVALLDGIIATFKVSVHRPVPLPAPPAALTTLQQHGGEAVRTRLARLDEFLTWPDKAQTGPVRVVTPLTAAQQALFEAGKALYAGSCGACHQSHGRGMDGLAPPLLDSEWVSGPPERLIGIVLHGVRGPIRVLGRTYNLDMPAFGFFDDEQVAAILTYIRREWEHTSAPVDAAAVKKFRAAHTTRTDAWTQPELLQLP